ncbi:MAG: hypothetical protein ACD_71C00062G0002 [uncultured bacterium (gcode 4)]|uniref:Methyltransferase type 11 domain-containing protein n=1 Tax=uncultured bacterium (gcode 4) TaxID=1234023 RepID=K1Z632_9BACT|nr:MAG: hypothetical protein ACD_71C00062G0002 [uncultured bacterium (gcode 4)]
MHTSRQDYIFSYMVDYINTPDESVWGIEDKAIANLLEKTEIVGKWLNLCAGDGRFNNLILKKADGAVAVDIDENALQKLVRITPDILRKKLTTKTVNVVKLFPFEDDLFDGIFCVGTLHLFSESVFKSILLEMERVLKSGGRIIIDFATDIKRTYPNGNLWIIENEQNYSMEEALPFLKEIFKEYKVNIIADKVVPHKTRLKDREYVFTSNFVLIDAIKK